MYVRTFKTCSVSKLHIHNTVLLSIRTLLYIWCTDWIYLWTQSLHSLMVFLFYPPPTPAPKNCEFPLILWVCLFWLHIWDDSVFLWVHYFILFCLFWWWWQWDLCLVDSCSSLRSMTLALFSLVTFQIGSHIFFSELMWDISLITYASHIAETIMPTLFCWDGIPLLFTPSGHKPWFFEYPLTK
jgi:hypothetical protein